MSDRGRYYSGYAQDDWRLSNALYSVNEDTVVRMSGARIFGSVKNTGGSSHWNGFIGGYNVTAPALPASSAFNRDQGWPSWPAPPFLVPNTLNGSSIPYWQPYDFGRLRLRRRQQRPLCRRLSHWPRLEPPAAGRR